MESRLTNQVLTEEDTLRSTASYDRAFQQVSQQRLPWWRKLLYSPSTNYQWQHRQAERVRKR
ncbi:hypothetical protein SAMN05421823_11551 [Catalinimonas alkaloidigena]|uniref:Uncharacterized protein n=1 Tax=Catalinimonas alkaloidigena TaxID=1075417 RepID=A0A1G9U0U6_9BACT|nr:hypothetical protein SAMN05421823_11551 [Catalinimonas alkaloidigena]